jgi:hypothetical protein
MPDKPTLPAITADFLAGLRTTTAASEDSTAKRFIEKLFAKGDKAVTSFFTRLQNALSRDIPINRVLSGFEKRMLSEASTEYTEAKIQRLEAKDEKEGLSDSEIRSINYAYMHEPLIEYEKKYNRRWLLGTAIQLASVPAAYGMIEAGLHEEEVKRKKEFEKTGKDRSEFYDGYRKMLARGKGVLFGVIFLLVGDHAKVASLPPSMMWTARGNELMEGLNDILTAVQGMRELDGGKSK